MHKEMHQQKQDSTKKLVFDCLGVKDTCSNMRVVLVAKHIIIYGY